MQNDSADTGATNPFQSPQPIKTAQIPNRLDDGLSFTERIEKNRKARKRWTLCCWALGSLLIGLSLASPPAAVYLTRIQQSLASSIVIGTGIVMLLVGILSIVLGPISWFWFHRRGDH